MSKHYLVDSADTFELLMKCLDKKGVSWRSGKKLTDWKPLGIYFPCVIGLDDEGVTWDSYTDFLEFHNLGDLDDLEQFLNADTDEIDPLLEKAKKYLNRVFDCGGSITPTDLELFKIVIS